MTAGRPGDGAAEIRVVVVTYFSGDCLEEFLDSLGRATHRPVEVICADNGSTDGSVERAAQRPGVRVLRSESNLGYGGAANAGATGATAPWLVVANPDVCWHPGSLDALLDAAERWPAGGAFGPAILTVQGDLYPSSRSFPSLSRGVGHALLGWWRPGNRFTRQYRGENSTPVEGPTGWLSGSCLLMRREAFESVHGFDPAYFMYFEDTDLGRRLADAGWQRIFVPGAVVEHLGGHATSRDSRRMLLVHHQSAYRYLARQYAGLRWAPLRAALAVGLGGRYLLSLLVPSVGEGAQPNRPGRVLDDVPAAVPPA